MATNNLPDIAKNNMLTKGINCSQAVFSTYVEQLSQGNIDYDLSLKMTSAFGGGVGGTGHICGALTGAIMSLGLKYGGATGEDQNRSNEFAIKLLDEFKSLNGTIICRELINHDLITDEDVKHAFANGSFNNCPKYVKDASMILETLL